MRDYVKGLRTAADDPLRESSAMEFEEKEPRLIGTEPDQFWAVDFFIPTKQGKKRYMATVQCDGSVELGVYK
ncbi:MAG: hypothetical protein QM690_22205 [Sphingobium sp.]